MNQWLSMTLCILIDGKMGMTGQLNSRMERLNIETIPRPEYGLLGIVFIYCLVSFMEARNTFICVILYLFHISIKYSKLVTNISYVLFQIKLMLISLKEGSPIHPITPGFNSSSRTYFTS